MVRDKPTIEEVLPEFEDFIEDAVLVAHNASLRCRLYKGTIC